MASLFPKFSARSCIYLGLASLLLLLPGQLLDFPDQEALAQVQRPQAPGLDGGVDWLNTDKALTLDDLRGRIVLLDFWTLC